MDHGENTSKIDTESTPWQYSPGDSISPSGSANADYQSHATIPQPQTTVEADNYGEMSDDGQAISWSASEYVAHQKTVGWYLLLVVAGFVLAVIVYLIMRDLVSATVIVLATILFAVYGARKPRVLQYRLDDKGITIGNSQFFYTQFRSFSVGRDGAFSSISLMPLKRFMPIMSMHFDPKDEDRIVTTLADRLPMEPSYKDPIDKLLQRIRF